MSYVCNECGHVENESMDCPNCGEGYCEFDPDYTVVCDCDGEPIHEMGYTEDWE